jgi:hypothetical protein
VRLGDQSGHILNPLILLASALAQMHLSAFGRQAGMQWGFTHSLGVAFSGLEWG